jgi:hypothetical protein
MPLSGKPSGAAWALQFPPSRLVSDLVPAFRDRVNPFIASMRTAGASVSIADTYRPPERAYLMHWCCMVAGFAPAGSNKITMVKPGDVPPMAGVDIDWTHGGDDTAARAAAVAMVHAYQIRFPAALASRHTQRRAIDMTIGWQGVLTLRDAAGNPNSIASGPRTGANPTLWAIGKTFGVVKLPSDPPHWSDDGR